MNQTATDLINALKLIDKPEKWGKSRYRTWDKTSKTHRYCSVGALLHVLAVEEKRAGIVTEILSGSRMTVPFSTRLDDACDAILGVIHADGHESLGRPLHAEVSKWNDDSNVWHRDVLFVFSEAIAMAITEGD